MTSKVTQILGIAAGVVVLVGVGVYLAKKLPGRGKEAVKRQNITIDMPKAEETVSLPITIRGHIPGTEPWIGFEGHAGTVQVLDAAGSPLSNIQPLRATSDWTIPPVNFEATIYKTDLLNKIITDNGFLRFTAENPSGRGEAKIFQLPVKFVK